jgi:phytoene dehydrogenase-like protein
VIPDLRERIVLELIGTPLTHSHYLRRYKGSLCPAIAAGKGMFPGCQTPISGLDRVGDSTMPGIGFLLLPLLASSVLIPGDASTDIRIIGTAWQKLTALR